MISYGDFTKGIRQRLWPYPGEVKSLVAAHDRMFLEAFIDLCKWIPCLQENHTDVYPACSTYVQCGLTVVGAPYGEIERVYTIANGDWCTKVLYEPAHYQRVANWRDRLLRSFVPPTNAIYNLPVLQQGLRYPEKSTDSPFGRSRTGIWANHRQRLYIAPWLQSNESLVIEWDGVKTDWRDTDLLDETYWTPDVARAVKLYVAWQHLRDYGYADLAPNELGATKEDYLEARADLIYWCNQRTLEKEKQEHAAVYTEGWAGITADQLKAEEVPPPAQPTVFAMLGDFATAGPVEADVATLIKSWKPSYIVTLGDNWYGTTLTETDLANLDAAVGQFFSDFIFPYTGSYGSGGTEQQKFLVTIGNHDRDPAGRLAVEESYFDIATPYYKVSRGDIDFFFYDSGYDNGLVLREADGVAVGSIQANWLQANLALSTAKFKIVCLHHPPFSSTISAVHTPPLAADGTISFPALQLPFKAWGASLVMSGHCHNYERLLGSDGMTYIINGAGGRAGTTPGEPALYVDTPLAISKLRFNDDFGAIRATLDCNSLTLEFFSRDGVLRDTVLLQ